MTLLDLPISATFGLFEDFEVIDPDGFEEDIIDDTVTVILGDKGSGFRFDPRVIQHQPLGFHDYNHLQMNAFAVVSDSGTLPEESSFFLSVGNPIPAVCIRTSTERPEALDKGNFILAGITTEQVLQAVDVAVEMNRDGALGIPVPNYVDENVSVKVVKLIQSYTGVVNKMVWRKY